ncbi:putative bifunctional diguanylate cyclase/phosphodiesterase [Photobacterium minamisatsumaniensis]|uniref:putative bifunctional diguanylate cyclase/phosphodiesterase n=1 Tax=Photobacterium minamisatsumaniensis TaxID=2910233 RepID=UPI003D0DEC68
MNKWKHKLSSRSLIILTAALLSAYLVLILAVTNLGQTRLKESQFSELSLKVHSYDRVLEYFFSVTQDELSDLTEDKTIEVFFSNVASGMSMKYGLGASLFKLNREFELLVTNTEIKGKPVYDHISLIGYNGTVIAKTKSQEPLNIDQDKYPVFSEDEFRIRTVRSDSGLHIQLIKRVQHAGKPIAFLVAVINNQVIIDQLTAQEYEEGHSRMQLVTDKGDILIWNSLDKGDSALEAAELENKIYFESQIENTPFKLKTWFEPVNEKDFYTSGWFIACLSFLAVPVVLGVMYIFIINNANITLKTKIKVSHKQQRLLSAQNQRLIEEIEKRRESEDMLAYQATHDALTGLPNRKYGNERLEKELLKAKRNHSTLLVMFIDIDNFKKINDTLGHLAGDYILQQGTNRLLYSVRQSDVLARLGGDEFLLIIPDFKSVRSAKLMASAILTLFDKPFIWHNQEVFLSTSIGLSIYPQDGNNAEQLLANADTAMYRVKQEGRNGFNFYTSDMNIDVQRNLDLDARLRQAISNEELELYYQPIVDLATNHIVGAEALMRWNDEKLGFISPEEFIPLAEKNGLIHPLGELALNKACTQAAKWQSILPLNISINFSSVQFRYCDKLYKQIRYALLQSGLPANKLDIEVTESLLFDHNEEVLRLLNRLQSKGVQLTIDDFGTGYSALSYLQKFPFDRLKIDRSFLFDMHENDADRELVNAIIAMAKALNLRVVAEGIEEQWHIDYLKVKGCDFGQGYLFSKPMPADEFELLLQKQVDLNANAGFIVESLIEHN